MFVDLNRCGVQCSKGKLMPSDWCDGELVVQFAIISANDVICVLVTFDDNRPKTIYEL